MMETRHVPTAALGIALVMLLAACNVPSFDTDQPAQIETPAVDSVDANQLAITGVTASAGQLSTCPDGAITIQAQLDPGQSSVGGVTLRYRELSGEPPAAGDWQDAPMIVSSDGEGLTYSADLAASSDPDSVVVGIEYWVVAVDANQTEVYWPAGKDSYASIPVSACQDATNAPETEFEVHEYGPSTSAVQYGGCATSGVTFEIIIGGAQDVESAEVKTTWLTGQGLNAGQTYPLQDTGPAEGYPNAQRFAADVDLASGAQQNLNGQAGNLGWNIYVHRSGGQTSEYPNGGPPVIVVAPCPVVDGTTPTPTKPLVIVPLPTATKPLVIVPLPTATSPTILINPAVLVHSQGEETMKEGQFFDLDEGQLANGGPFAAGDFHLDAGDDPYLDDIDPLPGAYFGWYGAQKPTKAQCENTLKSVASQTIQWPQQQGSYYCYETNAGRTGYLGVGLWVSLPLNERRFEFTWVTYP